MFSSFLHHHGFNAGLERIKKAEISDRKHSNHQFIDKFSDTINRKIRYFRFVLIQNFHWQLLIMSGKLCAGFTCDFHIE